jgi:hypothetical protein
MLAFLKVMSIDQLMSLYCYLATLTQEKGESYSVIVLALLVIIAIPP